MSKYCQHCLSKIESSEARVEDKCFHAECFVCANCKEQLLNTPFRMRENVLYCQKCFANLNAVKCAECKHLIKDKKRIEEMGQFYHPRHFVCFHCKGRLVKGFYNKKIIKVDGEAINCGFCPFCEDEFETKDCSKCKKPLNDQLVFEKGQYTHMNCGEAEERKKSSGKGVYKADPSEVAFEKSDEDTSSSSSSDSEQVDEVQLTQSSVSELPSEYTVGTDDLVFDNIPTISSTVTSLSSNNSYVQHPSQIPVGSVYHASKSRETPTVDVTSDPRGHMYGFESQGRVIDRKGELFKKEEFVPKERDMSDFSSEGNILERSMAIGKNNEPRIIDNEYRDRDFTSEGDIRTRATMYGKPQEVTPKEEKKLEGFETQGSVLERSKAMFKPKQALEEENQKIEEAKREGFKPQGTFKDRLSMFQGNPANENKQESSTSSSDSSSDSEHHHPVSEDKEYIEQQLRLSKLPRNELKVYSYEVLTSEHLPDDVDRERKQFHLSDEEFQVIFGMTKEDFESLKQGKQNWMRKEHRLF